MISVVSTLVNPTIACLCNHLQSTSRLISHNDVREALFRDLGLSKLSTIQFDHSAQTTTNTDDSPGTRKWQCIRAHVSDGPTQCPNLSHRLVWPVMVLMETNHLGQSFPSTFGERCRCALSTVQWTREVDLFWSAVVCAV